MPEKPRFDDTRASNSFRPDIQGLRAVAVILVLLCHAKVPFFAGGFIGVDVFFVISGFLITGLLAKEIRETGKLSLKSFYARRARRLLPMATLVLGFVALASLLLLPVFRQIEVGKDIFAAALYFVNWTFASEETNYFASSSGDLSPVLHYWSLAVEEQFYIMWPLLGLAVLSLATRFGRNPLQMLTGSLLLLLLLSLSYSILFTESNPQAGYFSTLTRIWELALGGLLALNIDRFRGIRSVPAFFLGAAGFLGVVLSAVLVSESDIYPGWIALFPVLATLSLLLSGYLIQSGWINRMLGTKVFQHIGAISYGWYLWHWPFLVFALVLWPSLSPIGYVLVVLASLLPTEISHRLIENPIRRSPSLKRLPRRTIAAGALCMFLAGSAGVAMASGRDVNYLVVPKEDVRGAAVVPGPWKVPMQKKIVKVSPDPARADRDYGELFFDDCMAWEEEVTQPDCTYGNRNSKKKVLLFGDSRAMLYFPAIYEIAKERDWKLVGLVRGNCLVADVDYEEFCDRWRRNMFTRIFQEERPDMVIVASATKSMYRVKLGGEQLSREASQPYLIRGMIRTINTLKAAGIKVVVLRDHTASPFKASKCVARNPQNIRRCAFRPMDRSERAFELYAASRTGTKVVDAQPMFCRRTICPAVIGDVPVYLDRYHVTATFSETLSPWLSTKIPDVRP